MADGAISITPRDIYADLRPVMKDSRWKKSLETYFCHAYHPLDPHKVGDVIQEFASQHGFAVYDMTARLHKTRTMTDLVKLYSTCVKLAMAKPMTLFFIAPNLEIPFSLNVVEGLFALRTSLVTGSFNIFFQDRSDASDKEKKCMRGKCFNLVLFQDDNITTLSNNTVPEIHRQLECLVSECPICLELLCDINHGALSYPFECSHAFHHTCVVNCKECPTCRTKHRMKGVVTFEMKRVG